MIDPATALTELEAAALHAAIEWRTHSNGCDTCRESAVPCEPGRQLLVTLREAHRALRGAHRRLDTRQPTH